MGIFFGQLLRYEVLNPVLIDLALGSCFYLNQKDQIILAPGQGILEDFWVPHEIETCNLWNLLKPLKI